MNRNEAMEKILNSFTRYYNVKTSDVEQPFYAEAEFHAHGIDSNEYAFFASVDSLDEKRLSELDKTAWERGLSRIKPYYGHRNSDVTLFVLADSVSDGAAKTAKKIRHYKSYYFSIYGWSHYKLAICDCSTGKCTFNRMGRDLRKIVSKLFT